MVEDFLNDSDANSTKLEGKKLVGKGAVLIDEDAKAEKKGELTKKQKQSLQASQDAKRAGSKVADKGIRY